MVDCVFCKSPREVQPYCNLILKLQKGKMKHHVLQSQVVGGALEGRDAYMHPRISILITQDLYLLLFFPGQQSLVKITTKKSDILTPYLSDVIRK